MSTCLFASVFKSIEYHERANMKGFSDYIRTWVEKELYSFSPWCIGDLKQEIGMMLR